MVTQIWPPGVTSGSPTRLVSPSYTAPHQPAHHSINQANQPAHGWGHERTLSSPGRGGCLHLNLGPCPSCPPSSPTSPGRCPTCGDPTSLSSLCAHPSQGAASVRVQPIGTERSGPGDGLGGSPRTGGQSRAPGWGLGWSHFWGPHLDPGKLPSAPGLLCQRLCAFLSPGWADQVPFLLCADWDPPDWTTGLTALNLGGQQGARPREGIGPQHCPVPSRGGSAAAQCHPWDHVA